MSPEDRAAVDRADGGEPAREAFERFTRRLIGLARTNLAGQLRHKVDPEDVVQSVYKSFFLRYGERVLSTEGLEGLWGLLTTITLRKCADRARYHKADCRDISREAQATADEPPAWQAAAGREPTPEEATILAETVAQVLTDLGPDERPIIELSLQGYSTQEISELLGRAERSVRRVRERARIHLERMQSTES